MLMIAGLVGAFMAASLLDIFSSDDAPQEPRPEPDETAPPENAIDGSPLEVALESDAVSPSHDISGPEAGSSGLTYPPSPGEGSTETPAMAGVSLQGGAGADIIVGGDGDDSLSGGDGNDQIGGYGGDDLLQGDAGHDDLSGDDGNDTVLGGTGNDTLFGGGGNDSLQGDEGNDFLAGQRSDDTLSGNDGNDSLIGGGGDDQLFGGDGADALQGGHDNDYLSGGTGQDTLMGDAGDDVLADRDGLGEPVRDFLNGGAGNDTIIAGEADWAEGGTGADDFILNQWLAEPHSSAIIADYNPDEDQIVVVFDPASHPNPTLTIEPANDGTGDMHILLDGRIIAEVLTSPDLTMDDLSLMPTDVRQVA